MKLPRLYIISGGREHACQGSLALTQAARLAGLPPVIFQLREKQLDARALYSLAVNIKSLLHSSGTILLINERTDIALAAHCDGVHLPETSCPVVNTRKSAPGLITGKSVHSPEAATEAADAGADYLIFSPVHATPSKAAYGPPQGLDKLELVCTSVSIPVYALGGVTPDRTRACIERGAYGVAALSPFVDPDTLAGITCNFLDNLPI